MIKSELVAQLGAKTGTTAPEAERIINTLIGIIYDKTRKGEEVNISGFGKFSVSHRKAREGVNPRTFKRIVIPAFNLPKFVAGNTFKRAVKIKKK